MWFTILFCLCVHTNIIIITKLTLHRKHSITPDQRLKKKNSYFEAFNNGEELENKQKETYYMPSIVH